MASSPYTVFSYVPCSDMDMQYLIHRFSKRNKGGETSWCESHVKVVIAATGDSFGRSDDRDTGADQHRSCYPLYTTTEVLSRGVNISQDNNISLFFDNHTATLRIQLEPDIFWMFLLFRVSDCADRLELKGHLCVLLLTMAIIMP